MALVLKIFSPLVKVLRIADGEKIPSLGFIYGEILVAKNSIKEATDQIERNYEPIIKIIDEKMKGRLDTPLHIAAYFLNPFYFYKNTGIYDMEVMQAFISCVETFYYGDFDKQNEVVNQEVQQYRNKSGYFGMPLAQKGCEKNDGKFDPGLWWSTYGCETPVLQKLAKRILALTSSSSGCERNWSCFGANGLLITMRVGPVGSTTQASRVRALYDDDFESEEEDGGDMEFEDDEDPVFRDNGFMVSEFDLDKRGYGVDV
ncbi:unnamed protein product [Microthlaspi erraticum]|uniref:HAT C-terminal dimerisation domain-containing protein n=1 Tax=Microthlaspi erraticum TaxID=1685480 RepID=A0A6D2JQ24_9BRAS|nr:unnamed protein product [Microthlaspi erraticum]